MAWSRRRLLQACVLFVMFAYAVIIRVEHTQNAMAHAHGQFGGGAAASHASPHVLRYHHVMERRKEVEHRATARGEPTEPGTAAETLRRLAAREPAVVLGAAAEVRARAVAARSARQRDRVTHDEAAAARCLTLSGAARLGGGGASGDDDALAFCVAPELQLSGQRFVVANIACDPVKGWRWNHVLAQAYASHPAVTLVPLAQRASAHVIVWSPTCAPKGLEAANLTAAEHARLVVLDEGDHAGIWRNMENLVVLASVSYTHLTLPTKRIV